MVILLVKVLLAPLAVLVASLLARRLGPGLGGFFIGLPTTSVPFLLAVHLSMGGDSTARAALGNVTGQLTCVLFCVLFVRVAPHTGGIRTTVLAVSLAAALAFPTLLLEAPFVVALGVVVVAAIGLRLVSASSVRGVTPAEGRGAGAGAGIAAPEPRWALPVRMVLVAGVVATFSSLAPLLGPGLAAFISSLPTILMVMGPLAHRVQGPGPAAALVAGCVGAIPGTVAYLVGFLLLSPRVGVLPALALSLAAIPVGIGVTHVLSGAHVRRRLLTSNAQLLTSDA